MRFSRVAFFFTLGCFALITQPLLAQPKHVIKGGRSQFKSIDQAEISKRLSAAAKEYLIEGDVARFALYDAAWPRDTSEFEALKGNTVTWIVAVTQKKEELPLKRVYVDCAGAHIELKQIFVETGKSIDASVKKTLGPYRLDALYLLPADYFSQRCDLMLDWQKNRSGFHIGKFPFEGFEWPFDPDEKYMDGKIRQPDKKVLTDFIAREFGLKPCLLAKKPCRLKKYVPTKARKKAATDQRSTTSPSKAKR